MIFRQLLLPVIFLLSTCAYVGDSKANNPRTYSNGGFSAISGVAFQGEPEKSYGWPVKVTNFDDVRKAREWNLNAFHIYISQ